MHHFTFATELYRICVNPRNKMFARVSLLAAAATCSTVQALEPFVPPIAIQSVTQASLPNVVNIEYDTPRSFLQKTPRTDVYFDQGPTVAMQEQEYEKVLDKVTGEIEEKFQTLRKSVLQGSFLRFNPGKDVKIFVDGNLHGKHIDMDRLNRDSMAYADLRVAALETELVAKKHTSFLHGDEVPRAQPVLNIDIPTRF